MLGTVAYDIVRSPPEECLVEVRLVQLPYQDLLISDIIALVKALRSLSGSFVCAIELKASVCDYVTKGHDLCFKAQTFANSGLKELLICPSAVL